MTVTLLSLKSGRLSLEFATADRPALAETIRLRYGDAETQAFATAAWIRFGGCAFAFQDEWDDPCLISTCAAGDAILRTLHAALNARQALP